MKHKNAGLSLIELIIVIAIIIILILIAWMSWRNQFNKAKDANRKDDLQRLSIAFEEYFTDNDCYPSSDILDNCGGNEFSPYLETIPCDPLSKTPYCYVSDGGCPQNFRILSSLDSTADPIITKLQCHGPEYCGYEVECEADIVQSGYNYGVTSTNVTVLNPDVTPPSPSPSVIPTPSPSPSPAGPSPSPLPGIYACDPNGQCNEYEETSTCGITFDDFNICNAYCPTSDPLERCAY